MVTLNDVRVLNPSLKPCEGGVVSKDGVIYGGTWDGDIYRILPPDHRRFDIMATGQGMLLGVALDRQDSAYYCARTLQCVLKVNKDGHMSQFGDSIFFPNFGVFNPDGVFYVSCSKDSDATELGSVWRIEPSGKSKKIAAGFKFTNGLAMSADGRYLYIIETFGGCISRLELKPDGAVVGREVYVDGVEHGDGMAFDAQGNLYVTLVRDATILKVTPDRKKSILIKDDKGEKINYPSNLSFCGPKLDQLLICHIRATYAVLNLGIQGQKLYHQT